MPAAPKTVGGVPPSTLTYRVFLFLAAVSILGVFVPSVGMAQTGTTQAKPSVHQKTTADYFKTVLLKAEQGDVFSQVVVGSMYDSGQGVPEDHVQALVWFRKAAEQGDAGAQCILAEKYLNGQGVPQDYAQAVEWYRKAAEQGFVVALSSLGSMCSKGQGHPQDYIEGYKWMSLAASRGMKESEGLRDTLAQKMTPAQIAEAQKRASEWLAAFEKRKR
jgi:TPR repeat protein